MKRISRQFSIALLIGVTSALIGLIVGAWFSGRACSRIADRPLIVQQIASGLEHFMMLRDLEEGKEERLRAGLCRQLGVEIVELDMLVASNPEEANRGAAENLLRAIARYSEAHRGIRFDNDVGSALRRYLEAPYGVAK